LHRKGGTKTALFAPSCFARADAPAHPPPQGFFDPAGFKLRMVP
jgi:hypothetical protein